jgi:hypothetical protein
MTKLLIALLLVLVLGLSYLPGVSSHAYSGPLFQVSASMLYQDTIRGIIYYHVDSLWRIDQNGLKEEVDSLVLTCPVKDITHYTAIVSIRDTVRLYWEQKRAPSGGYILRGGRPEVAEIISGPYKWVLQCMCEDNDKPIIEYLSMFLVDSSGHYCSRIEIKGKKRGFWANRIPFKHGCKAEPPARVNLVMGWDLMREKDTNLSSSD